MNMVGHAGTKHGLSNVAHTRRVRKVGTPVLQAFRAAIVFLALAANALLGQEVPPAGKDSAAKPRPAESASGLSMARKAEIERAIADLGNADFAVRERASQALWSAGVEAEPALQKAIRETDDFEVVYRVQRILESFQLGIYADTPAETIALIGQFRMGSFNMKQEIGRRLREKGKTALLQRLIAKEASRDVREQLKQILLGSGSAIRVVPRTTDAVELARQARLGLARGDFDRPERLLRSATDDASVRDYAALLLGQNKLDATIAQVRLNLKPTDEPGQRRLAWMLRAKGDLAGAVGAAKLVNDNELVEDLLAEMADWKELARIHAKADLDALAIAQNGMIKLGAIMVFRHLAGEKQACDLAAAALVKILKQRPLRYGNLLGVLILSDRIGQAIEISKPLDVRAAFELLLAQNRLKDAFRLVKIDVPIPAKVDWTSWLKDGKKEIAVERRFLAYNVIRALHVAGENVQAQELIAALLAVVRQKQAENGWEMHALLLVDAEVAIGRTEAIDALANKVLDLGLENPEMVIARLYRDHGAIAALLWRALRKQSPGEERLAALKHLRRLLTGKPDATVVEELHRLALGIEAQLDAQSSEDSAGDETSDPQGRDLLALATLFHRCGQGKLTMKYLARIGTAVSAQTLIEQGNLYSEEKQWNEAVKSYGAAWAKDRRSATAVYLLGWAQSKHGEEAEGRKRMELALVIPLADGESRRDLAQTLDRLHQGAEAARQRQWVLRLATPHDRSILQVLMETGDAAVEKGEKVDAANLATVWQRATVELLSGNVFLSENRFYMQPPVSAHSARARDLLRAGKTAAAIEELHEAEAAQPANIQLALDCDSDLRKHGAAGEADALYRRMLEQHEAFCRDFPRSGTYHNDLAWLAANLDRDLDKALAHAQQAVELEPQSAGILDTLAEVYFRRGSRAEALRLTKRCLEMDPDGEHYKKQLARFEGK